jgi:DNA-binding Xre family transcriptional regulator
MLIEILTHKIQEKQLSLRGAAREIGIAHTTLQRFLAGKPYEMDTVLRICKFLDIAPETALNSLPNNSDRYNDLLLILQSEPYIAHALLTSIDDFHANRLTKEDLLEIIEFVAFKIQSRKWR